jgi:predicted GIY-YIG superfamily endonuclease
VCYSVQDGIPGYSAARAAWVPDVETKVIAAGRIPSRPSDVRAQLEARPTHLYRLYADDGELLYVGIAVDLEHRMTQHAADKPWWGKVDRHEVETYPNRLLAETAEAQAIRRERPRYNLMHNGGRA